MINQQDRQLKMRLNFFKKIMKTQTYKVTASEVKKGKILEVIFEGDLSLKNAGAILKSLQALKTVCHTVVLKIRNVAKLDITTIQTIRVFKTKLSADGKDISVEAELSGETERLLKNSGINSIS